MLNLIFTFAVFVVLVAFTDCVAKILVDWMKKSWKERKEV